MEGRDQVVVLLARLVIEEHLPLNGILNQGLGDGGAALGIACGGCHGGFKRVVSSASVAVGEHRNLPQQVVRNVYGLSAESALFVIDRAAEKRLHLVRRKSREHGDFGA